jgi:hypothetical protein
LMFGAALLHGSSLECVLYVKVGDGLVGGPFPKLAREVAQLRDRGFEYTPRSPQLPVNSAKDLRHAVQFAVSLYRDARNVICSFHGWTEARKPRRKSD